MRVREAAVAGLFYADDSSALGRELDELLDGNQPGRVGRLPRALIVPHAGYAYSGRVAARADRLRGEPPDRFRRVPALAPGQRVPLARQPVATTDD